ncbi:MAG: SDR family oxidoreductase [Williamsia sp.]|nr:SDR family oxidoreductase [Williamsia sp.]
MGKLKEKEAVVIGGSRGTGLAIVHALAGEGANVLIVSRNPESLTELAATLPGVQTMAADATDEATIANIFQTEPDIVVLAAGAKPPIKPVQELDWATFSANWNTDVKAAYLLAHYAINTPVKPGTLVIFISSGAALFGSPISGGYAGAKRTQMFLANYAQEASNRLSLGLRFIALAPLRLMPDTSVGELVIPAYAAYNGISEADFIARMSLPQTKENVAESVVAMADQPPSLKDGNVWFVSGKGAVTETKLKELLNS